MAEAEIDTEYAPVYWNSRRVAKTELIYHLVLQNQEEAKIKVKYDDGNVVVKPGPLALYATGGIESNVDEKSGEVGFGVLGIIVAGPKMLFVKKRTRTGSFWYVPGGRVENCEESLSKALMRKVREETGVRLVDIKYNMTYCYESVTPSRHNLMGFYLINDFDLGGQEPVVEDARETIKAKWMDPAEVYAKIKTERMKSLASIDLVFVHYVKHWFFYRSERFVHRYEDCKRAFLTKDPDVDLELMDLCMIRLVNNLGDRCDVESVALRAYERAKSLLKIE